MLMKFYAVGPGQNELNLILITDYRCDDDSEQLKTLYIVNKGRNVKVFFGQVNPESETKRYAAL